MITVKICTRCKTKKSFNEFNFKIKSKGTRSAHCKNCSRLYLKEHYSKNKDYYLKKARNRNKSIQLVIKRYVWEYLNKHRCIDCGEKDPVVLEFDHIRDKKWEISRMNRTRTLKQVKEEIVKCEVRCANCHRRKTAKQFNWYKFLDAPVA